MKEIEENLDIMKNPEKEEMPAGENYDFSKKSSSVFAQEMKFSNYLSKHFNLGSLFILFYIIWILCFLLSIPISTPNNIISMSSLHILPEAIFSLMLPIFIYWTFEYIFFTPNYSNIFIISDNRITKVLPSNERNMESDYLVQSTFEISNLEDMKYESSNVILEFGEDELEIDLNRETEIVQDILYNF